MQALRGIFLYNMQRECRTAIPQDARGKKPGKKPEKRLFALDIFRHFMYCLMLSFSFVPTIQKGCSMKHFPSSLFASAAADAGSGSADPENGQHRASARPRHFEDMRTTGVNREPMHAPIYGTFFDEASAEAYRETPSKYTLDLNGIWKFQLFGMPDEAPDEFVRPEFEDAEWLDMAVPSNWQSDMRVPDRGVYLNNIYLFQKNANPPLLPDTNPTGCYRRTFDIPAEWLERDVRIVFDGVDSAYDFWVNGQYAGYAEDSRLPSEFAVTKLLKPGKNTVAVKVYRFSTGSYLECQDVWRMSGIYRDVRLMALSPVHLRDWSVRTAFTDPAKNEQNGKSDADLDIKACVETRALPRQPVGDISTSWYPGVRVKARLLDADGNLVAESEPAKFCGQTSMYGQPTERGAAEISMRIAAPEQWSPDSPYLYKLFLHLIDDSGKTLEVQYVPVGFRQIEIRGRDVLLNGRRLIVRGVDRHDFNAKHAFAVTEEDMRLDIGTMKKLNFNAVRTSHYPNNNRWYELCNEYGLLLVDETDIETHGLGAQLAKDPAWGPVFLERAERMVLRDRNNPCVAFWSLGNESGCGANHAAMANWIRFTDPTRPVQYESCNPPPLISDIYCPMYPRIEHVKAVMDDPSETRPLILCEYAYAKGNATGDICKYWDLVHENRGFHGGFVWDWADKALLNAIAKTGETDYGYGNDFGENYDYPANRQEPTQVLNGIVDASLKPHPGAQEVRVCQAPIRFQFDGGKITVINERNNASTAGLEFRWEITRNGCIVNSGSLDVPVTECFESATVDLPFLNGIETKDDMWFLNLYCDAPTHEITRAQFPLGDAAEKLLVPGRLRGKELPAAPGTDLEPTETEDTLTVGMFAWSKKDGRLVSMKRPDGTELLAKPAEEIFFRAPTCNDRILGQDCAIAKDWEPLFHADRRLVNFEWQKTSGQFFVHVTTRIADRIDSEVQWRIGAGGNRFLDYQQEATFREEDLRSVARIGILFPLVGGFDKVKYFGRGPYENYPDRRRASLIGRWEAAISDMLENYLVPSECGSRGDVFSLELSGDEGKRLRVFRDGGIRFSALHVSPWDLMAAAHGWELKPDRKTWLILDGAHMGVGGDDGWTVNIHEEYRLRPGTYRMSFSLDLFGKEDADGNPPES
jgi:beta-galactosidase